MSRPEHNSWLHRFAVLTAAATLALIGIGGLVTSHGAGMAVPDWPTSYGYNMFALPIRFWQGGIFYEHTHRLWASCVGVLVVALTRWLGGRDSRLTLAVIGLAEVLAGAAIFTFAPDLKGAGHFLTGIGGVVLLAALVWVRNPPDRRLAPLGWLIFGLVQFQGLLGGLRVVLFKDQIGIFHAALAQIFFVLTCAVAVFTSRWWMETNAGQASRLSPSAGPPDRISDGLRIGGSGAGETPALRSMWKLFLLATSLIFLQLILGATMRHQHAGLAIPDFPLAYGKLWPAIDPDSLARYNAQRMEATALNPITAFQIELQMVHRILAVLILAVVGICAWRVRNRPGLEFPKLVPRLAWSWFGLILLQAGLGAATVLTQKAADVATAHVLAGALSLATGAVLCIITRRSPEPARRGSILSAAGATASERGSLATGTAAT